MTAQIVFDPLLPLWLIAALAGVVFCGLILGFWRGLSGAAFRALAVLVVLAALAGPVYQQEDREPLSDIVLMVVDQSASNRLGDRAGATARAAEALTTRIEARDNTELRRINVPDGADNTGTRLMTALSQAMSEEPASRIAGAILLSDGQTHDPELAPDMPAPLHLLQTGRATDWDRRLTVDNAPAFAILGEEITMTLTVEDIGAVPGDGDKALIEVSVDGDAPQRFVVTLNEPTKIPLDMLHAGRNVLQFTTPTMPGELTDRNNTALVQINGVRDRLRVLLVSGEPHAGGRTWRNLLKSDSSVDLVHFTILRPPEKQDGVPVQELSLIAFPTRELFLEKIDGFDLIIFDRYKRRGILPSIYLENVRNYVEKGGAVLIAAGPDFASADSLYRTPLEAILPARPTARVIEEAFLPEVTDLGKRHPVTAGLRAENAAPWGRWLRQIEVEQSSGDVVMSGAKGRPLLVLDRVGKGRVALLASDQAWLWDRGYEGGGPQLELLRRLAHWMMKEPELEDEALWAEANGQTMRIIRQSLLEDVGPVTITTPSGEVLDLPLAEVSPGRHEVLYEGPEIGLYRLQSDDQQAVIGLGPAAPVEFEQTIASAEGLLPVIKPTGGGARAIEDGLPRIRSVRAGRPASGRGWIGLTPRGAYETRSVTQMNLLPGWLVLLLSLGLILAGWLREGRR
ncbi:FIG003492: Threonine dehydrogenase and related Zn-dependent dehydrogenases [hydrothermal vent metagenome]|uniref:FIG003492: Threonine dehydrogenase and related Zn-dependent dehydrogenases n=1 Tax=hydrothermal vent metagenome TaxID=652676 RepID=A0A3B0SY08_9ZZZZ